MSVVALAAGCLLDALLGEPRRAHPLTLFGHGASALEGLLRPRLPERFAGGLAVGVLVLPAALLAGVAASLGGWLVEAVIVYFCLGHRALREHAHAVAAALTAGDLPGARQAVGRMVGRRTETLDTPGVARAATETVLENGNDAVLATVFWFLVGGAPAAVAHRLVNTLDAMWGYRSPPWRHFGAAAARLDDLLGWIPARLSVLSYAVLSMRPAAALRAAWRDGGRWDGVNPGPVMAAGAGALGVPLGGAAEYEDGPRDRPRLGERETVAAADADAIHRALGLVLRSLVAWIALAAAVTMLFHGSALTIGS